MNHEINKIPIADYLISNLGYKVKKDKDCRTWRALQSPEGENILANSLPLPDGNYIYKDLQNGKTATLSFLLKKKGLLIEAPSKNSSFNFEQKYKKFIKKNVKDLFDQVSRRLEISRINWTRNYLRERYIRLSKDQLEPLIRGSKFNEFEAVFPLFFVKKLVQESPSQLGIDLKGIDDIFTNLHLGVQAYNGMDSLFYPNTKRVLGKKGISVLGHSDANIYLFESPIDALSFHQIQNEKESDFKGLYLSTCGRLGNVAEKHLLAMIDIFVKKRDRTVFLCFDKDEEGESMSKRLSQFLTLKAVKNQRILPSYNCKDWNESLQKRERPIYKK